MLVTLPNLDDRRWAELVDEARALIPFYAPEWTDHNVHDPGITLVELFAWLAEAQIYQVNRVPERHRRKFLSLVGIAPAPPEPARAVVAFALSPGSPPIVLPATTELETGIVEAVPIRFRLPEAARIASGAIVALFREGADGWHDLTSDLKRHEPLAPLGNDPRPGDSFSIAFSEPFPVGIPVTLFASVQGESWGHGERSLLESTAQAGPCASPPQLVECDCGGGSDNSFGATGVSQELTHHSARLVWEYAMPSGTWRRLDALAGEVVDRTRAFTLSGAVTIQVPTAMGQVPIGPTGTTGYALRCRFLSGALDAAPKIADLSLNGFVVEQAVPVEDDFYPPPNSASWDVAQNAQIVGHAEAGDTTGVRIRLDAQGRIDRLTFDKDERPFLVTAYEAPGVGPGRLELEAEHIGIGTGFAWQRYELLRAPVDRSSVRVYTLESGRWRRWRLRQDFDASKASDLHCVLDPQSGWLSFGDGRHGRAATKDAPIVVTYRSTRTAAGNAPAGSIASLAKTVHNERILARVDPATGQSYHAAIELFLESFGNPLAASGGRDAESIGDAEARAVSAVARSERAVTLVDFEMLAMKVPGVRLARAEARANVHPAFPCLRAPGVVTVMVLPFLPAGRPVPSAAALRMVASHLDRRRVLGTRVEVVGPTYRLVAVRARLQAKPHVDPEALTTRAIVALDQWFDPLIGGPDRDGWPFGRDVYRSEVLQLLDQIPGVDHVLELELVADGCDATCANVCLGAFGLVDSGRHVIEVAT